MASSSGRSKDGFVASLFAEKQLSGPVAKYIPRATRRGGFMLVLCPKEAGEPSVNKKDEWLP